MSETAKPSSHRQLDAVLHLLDRQVVDADGQLVCKVDDLELQENPDGTLVVTAILVGPGALGPRLHGKPAAWTVAIWRRLHPEAHPRPGRLDIEDVERLDSAVHLRTKRAHLPLGIDGWERWCGRQIIDKLPGQSHDPE
jgi:hypothetical protein